MVMMFYYFVGFCCVYFVGVGGVGMSGIVELLFDYDFVVLGLDFNLSVMMW